MNLYSLNNSIYLYEDINYIMERINELYDFKAINGLKYFESKLYLDNNVFWVSDESAGTFNKFAPKIRSIHKDVYHILECVIRDLNGDNFDIKSLESKYPNLQFARDFNNKIKHQNKKNIDVMSTIIMDGITQRMEIVIQDNDRQIYLNYSELLILFLQILEDYKIIEIDYQEII